MSTVVVLQLQLQLQHHAVPDRMNLNATTCLMRTHPTMINSATLENMLAINIKNNGDDTNSNNNTVALKEKVPTANHTNTDNNPRDFNQATSSNSTTPPPPTYKSSSPPSSKATTLQDIALRKLPMARKYPTYPIVKCICINLMRWGVRHCVILVNSNRRDRL